MNQQHNRGILAILAIALTCLLRITESAADMGRGAGMKEDDRITAVLLASISRPSGHQTVFVASEGRKQWSRAIAATFGALCA